MCVFKADNVAMQILWFFKTKSINGILSKNIYGLFYSRICLEANVLAGLG